MKIHEVQVHGDPPGKNTGVGCHGLLQGIFPTQGLNPCQTKTETEDLCLSLLSLGTTVPTLERNPETLDTGGARDLPLGVKRDQDVHGAMSAFDGALVLPQEVNPQAQRCTEALLPSEAGCHSPILWVRKGRGSTAYPASPT